MLMPNGFILRMKDRLPLSRKLFHQFMTEYKSIQEQQAENIMLQYQKQLEKLLKDNLDAYRHIEGLLADSICCQKQLLSDCQATMDRHAQALQLELARQSSVLEKLLIHFEEMDTTIGQQKERLETLGGQIAWENQATRDALAERAIYADVAFEHNYYKTFYTRETPECPQFRMKFQALIRGLDAQSIQTVALSLKRLQMVQATDALQLPLYDRAEQEECRMVHETLHARVLQVAEECFFWNRYYLPVNHFESAVFLGQCGVPHLKHPERLKEKDIIDAGAFIGDSALMFSPLTTRRIHAFEPVPENYALLEKTIALNHCENISPLQLALGAQPGTISIAVNGSSSTQYENEALEYQTHVDARVVTIDDYVRENNITVGLIKADLEGAEQEMLRGAMKTIKTQRPALLISIYHNADDFFHIKPMLESLNLGYRFKIFHPTFGSVMTETMLLAEIEEE